MEDCFTKIYCEYVSVFMHCIIETAKFTKHKKGLTCIGMTALLGYLDPEGILSVYIEGSAIYASSLQESCSKMKFWILRVISTVTISIWLLY